MIQLNPTADKTYKLAIAGYSVTSIAGIIGVNQSTVRDYLNELVKAKLLRRKGSGTRYTPFSYFPTKKKYEVTERGLGRQIVPPEKEIPEGDQLLSKTMNTKLTTDQEFYLRNHRNERRSVLAKKLGIPKLKLNFFLEQMGEGA